MLGYTNGFSFACTSFGVNGRQKTTEIQFSPFVAIFEPAVSAKRPTLFHADAGEF